MLALALAATLAAAVTEAPARRKVLAHYHWFTRSIDDKPAPDYYDCWRTPECEGGKHAASGGYLWDRPTRRPPLGPGFDVLDKRAEVEVAKAAGIDGFLVNVGLLTTDARQLGSWGQLAAMLEAAAGSGFGVVPNIDASQVAPGDAATVRQRLADVVDDPAVLHLPDGRAVVGAYMPERWPDAAWTIALAGLDVAFVPTFLDWQDGYGGRVPQTYAEGLWGSRDPATTDITARAAEAHAHGRRFVAPVRGQDCRPYAFSCAEPLGPTLLRAMWGQASRSADWVQLVTWNDYSESTHLEPSEGTGAAFLGLSRYYAACFKGRCPRKADELWWFQRDELTTAPHPLQGGEYGFEGPTAPDDRLWLVVRASAGGGVLRIACGGAVVERRAGPGVSQLSAPAVAGCTPAYEYWRAGRRVLRAEGLAIRDAVAYQNLLYFAGTGTP